MKNSVLQLLEDNNITCSDLSTLDSSFNYSISSLDALDHTEDSHFWSVSKRKLVKHLLLTYLKADAEHASVLDIGCGNGGLLQYIKHEFPQSKISGMDGYANALMHCRRRSKSASLFLQDITRLSHAGIRDTFDVLTLMDVLEHLDHPSATLTDFLPFLRPDGIVIATVPASQALWSDRDVFLEHRKRYNKSAFTDLFLQSGYRVLHTNYAYSYLFPPVYVYRKWVAPFCKMNGESVEASELRIVPVINGILKKFGALEISITNCLPIPFGTSVYVVAQKQ